MPAKQAEEHVFSQPILPGQRFRMWWDRPYPCKIAKVIRHWPPGCNGLVDVAVGVGTRSVLPETGYVALNNATPTQENMNIPVPVAQQIWVEVANRDALNAHQPSVTVFVEEVKAEEVR